MIQLMVLSQIEEAWADLSGVFVESNKAGNAEMAEPDQLFRGKKFQALVQGDFIRDTRDGKACAEAFISFAGLAEMRKKSGRVDILLSELGDFVTVLEIKATDWDKIAPVNIRRNLYRHQRQLFSYVDKYVEVDKLDVCLGIVYPRPPENTGVRRLIETYLQEEFGVPVYWYSEIQ